jgi:hypothetical protein
MKNYIKQNIIPIVIGINIGMLAVTIVRSIEDTFIKIALINAKK